MEKPAVLHKLLLQYFIYVYWSPLGDLFKNYESFKKGHKEAIVL